MGSRVAGVDDVGAEAVRIKVRENGPLLVTGPVVVVDHVGREFAVSGPNVALCRCGRSLTKPFCDGSHRGRFDGTCPERSYTSGGG